MNDESRDKKKIYDVIAKNRFIFALAGSIITIIAFYFPMLQFVWYDSDLGVHGRESLWVYGYYEEYGIMGDVVLWDSSAWFGALDEQKFGIAMFSIASTAILLALVWGTIFIASNILIRKRKEGVYSSRLFLCFSIGIYAVANIFVFYFPFIGNWHHPPDVYQNGPLLFNIGAVLILIGYTVNIKSILRIVSLYVAGVLVLFAGYALFQFLWMILWSGYPLDPSGVEFQFNRLVIPAAIAILWALAIVIVNLFILILRRRIKRKSRVLNR